VNWDPIKDFSGVTTLADVPMVLVISPDKKVGTLQQLVAQAKANPGSLNYATAGLGAPTHLAFERLRLAAGFSGQLVPFKGAGEALTEVATGRVDVYFSPLAASMPLIESGKLKPLAVSGTKRAAALPDVPTTTEAGFKDSDFAFYVGMYVPKDTPRDVIDRMNAEVKKVLAMPSIQEKLAKIGSEATSMDPAALDKRTAEESAVTKSLVEAAKISVQ
jgi:tripartite-type tricarboxylate transporter receptor subunit TctC